MTILFEELYRYNHTFFGSNAKGWKVLLQPRSEHNKKPDCKGLMHIVHLLYRQSG
jgi:hypothetical protein